MKEPEQYPRNFGTEPESEKELDPIRLRFVFPDADKVIDGFVPDDGAEFPPLFIAEDADY